MQRPMKFARPMPLNINNLDLTDNYKDPHADMMPEGLTDSGLYYEARGGAYPYSCLFGLQGNILSHIAGEFVTQSMLDEQVEEVLPAQYGPAATKSGMIERYRQRWQYIINVHGGRLPLKVRAVPEGLPIPVSNVMFTIKPTDPKCAWLPGWTEGLWQHAWYGSGVFTRSRSVQETQMEFLLVTADPLPDGTYPLLIFSLHDFAFRGVSSVETAAIGAAAHLCNFVGTDTKIGNQYLYQYYGAPRAVGRTVIATEHSIMTMRGRAGEVEAVRQTLAMFPGMICSIVGDSYDIYHFTSEIIGGTFRDEIKKRGAEGKVVVRPDSGDPTVVVPKLLEILGDKFGYTVNSKGYKVLAPCVGIIWGDGIDEFGIRRLYQCLKDNGWSAENLVVGMGGGLLQKINRDTQKVAIKMCYSVINGTLIEVYKDPITDIGKRSKRGDITLVRIGGNYQTVQDNYRNGVAFDVLEDVFENGDLTRFMTYEQVCANRALQMEVAA